MPGGGRAAVLVFLVSQNSKLHLLMEVSTAVQVPRAPGSQPVVVQAWHTLPPPPRVGMVCPLLAS